MFERFYPHTTKNNVFEMDEKFYRDNGIKGVIFDIDNTLVTHDTLRPPKEILDYFAFLENLGIKYAIASNNNKERVNAFCENLDIPYVGKSWKPFKKNLKKICREFGLWKNEVCLVGDQIFSYL